MKNVSRFWGLILAFVIAACGASPTPDPVVLTPPAISLNLTKGGCPSIEIQPGMQIAWTNLDDVDHSLIVERVDEQGVVMESGGTPALQPGTTFMITLTEEGQYTYYCSIDRKQFGTIHVIPDVSASVRAHSTQEAVTPQCVESPVSPAIIEIQPAQPSVGTEITVIGSGGFIQDSCGGVNESARTTEGSHCLSTQKQICEFQFMVVKS